MRKLLLWWHLKDVLSQSTVQDNGYKCTSSAIERGWGNKIMAYRSILIAWGNYGKVKKLTVIIMACRYVYGGGRAKTGWRAGVGGSKTPF